MPIDANYETNNAIPDSDFETLRCLVRALLDYAIDAICVLLLPPCPAPPCEERLILACVTVKNGKILHICNFDCRHYAGSFNSVAYWMSAFPVLDILSNYVREICCRPELTASVSNVWKVAIGAVDNTPPAP